MFLMTDLPQHDLYGLIVRPGDILGRTTPAAIFEHRFLLGFDGQIAHSPGPSDVFRSGWLAEVLKDGGVLRIVDPTSSLQETQRRFINANRLIGVSWWSMDCIRTTDFIAIASRDPWMM